MSARCAIVRPRTRGTVVRLFIDNRPAFGWEGPATDDFAATTMALKSFAMACRAIAFARGRDPDSAIPPEAEVRIVEQHVNERYVDWSIARSLLEALPGRPKKGGIGQEAARGILTATFAGKAQELMTGSFNAVQVGFEVKRPNILDGVFTVRATGLVLQTGALGRTREWDPMDTAEALAVACAYAARNEKARDYRTTEVKARLDRLGSASLRAAALRQDDHAAGMRAILAAISGTKRPHRTSYQ